MDRTVRLFDHEPYGTSFEAAVISCRETEGGYEVVLDKTLFFPEEGGQAADTGMLGGALVTKVYEKEGIIYHVVDNPLAEDSLVSGKIDFAARFRKMQNHTGEHIVSGLIYKKFGFNNVGFHLGAEDMTADFDGELNAEQIKYIEELANKVVFECHSVKGYYPDAETLKSLEYRSKLDLTENVRIVEIEGVDTCACCAPHVKRTGEIGIVKIISAQKFHQGTRLQMLCGKRAYGYLAAVYRQNQQVSQAFSAKPLETAAAAARMNEALNAEKFRAGGLEKRVFACIAESYANRGDTLRFEPGLSSAGVRDLADAIAAVCGGTAAVFSGEDGAYQVCLVNKGGDVKALGTAMNKALNGRGGGKPGYFQGSVKAARGEIENFLAAWWE